MSLSPEQKQIVATWVAAGDTLAGIQRKLSEQFEISLTYMDVRFLVDDLGLELKNPVPSKVAPEADLTKARPVGPAQPEKKGGLLDKLKKAVGAGGDEAADSLEPVAPAENESDFVAEDVDALAAGPPAGRVKVDLDRVVRPGAVVSGSVTFSDGTASKWALDQYGRVALDTGKKGYQPPAGDVQAFQRELSQQLQRHGY
jgi:hypothetical protein